MSEEKPEEAQDNLNKIVEGVDYYFNEDGFIVFTETYHHKRGYCCESGCKHCPYEGNQK